MPSQPNETLTSYLKLLGWSPRELARHINKSFGSGTVSETAPYGWRDRGRVPHPPLPRLSAYVLSCALGRQVSVEELWQGRAVDSPMLVPAVDGMDMPWDLPGTLRLVEDWLLAGLMDRRKFLAVSGPALTGLAWEYLRVEPGRLVSAFSGRAAGDALTCQIEESIHRLRQLDDNRGGGHALAYVGAQFQAVSLLLHQGGHSDSITRRLLVALGELGQLAGWMGFDSGHHGLAQRYFLTGLRAAHETGDRPLAAHILGDLSYQASSRGASHDAVALGEASQQAAAGASATTRASVAGRLAYAYAVAGDREGFSRARGDACELFADRQPGHDPVWAYYLTQGHLDAQAGYSMVHMARGHLADGNRRAARALLDQGERLLTPHAFIHADHPWQRKALFEGSWLALAYTSNGKLDQACSVGRIAVQRLEHVRSPRCVDLLRTLRTDLRRGRHHNPAVREFLPELETALHRAA